MSQGSFNPKIRILGQKVCSVAHVRTHTDTQKSEYRGHPFSVSGYFPSTYHKGSVQIVLIVYILSSFELADRVINCQWLKIYDFASCLEDTSDRRAVFVTWVVQSHRQG